METMHSNEIDPILIQAWVDGELSAEDLDGITAEELENLPLTRSLRELSENVRSELRHEMDYDESALWSSISARIAVMDPPQASAPSTAEVVPLPSRSGISRWIPTIAAAALFLVSIPGLVGLISRAVAPQAPGTVVYLNGAPDAIQHNAVNSPAHTTWQTGECESIQRSRLVIPDQKTDDQLTVEEMDTAIRILMQRLKSLEDDNQARIESGVAPMIYPAPDKL